jgi:hypothetical protein
VVYGLYQLGAEMTKRELRKRIDRVLAQRLAVPGIAPVLVIARMHPDDKLDTRTP